ncbi:MAG TPA: hypothetical protein VHS80_03620, partial [Chthoniobacterales bacterium]|nr:hypothetical protein [Chthoniobacterales bacterium]
FSKLDDASDDAQRQLKAAPVRHAAASLAGYQTLQALHDAGALEILCSLANAQEHLIGQVSAGLNKPEASADCAICWHWSNC